jgi:sugar lactone lactonase YvrE
VHGLRFDGQDALYAASVIGQSIFRVDPQTGAVETAIGPRSGMADDLAISPDGTFVWTAIEDGVVYARPPGGEIRELMTGRKGVNAVSFSPDGRRLFVTLVFYGDALYELDVTGSRPPRLILENLGGLNAFEVAHDGQIYGPLVFERQVVRINPDTGALRVIAEGFQAVGALKLDGGGGAYVLDNGAATLTHVDLATGRTRAVARLPFGADNLDVRADGHVFVSLSEVNAIIDIDPSTGAWRYVVPPAALTSATGLAVARDGGSDVLYLGDLFGGVKRIDPASGRVEGTPIDIFQPAHVSIRGDRLLVVSEVFGAIQRVDRRSYAKLAEWTGFDAPADALEAPDGSLVVAERGSGRLLRVSDPASADRRVLTDGLDGPTGLAWAGESSVYLSEAGAGRILRIQLANGARSVVVEGLQQPEGIAVLDDGSLVVIEVAARRLRRVRQWGGEPETIASGLPVGLSNGPSLYRSVAASGSTVYFNSDLDNAVYRVTLP